MKTILKDDYFAYPENQIKFKIRPKSTTTFAGHIEHPDLRVGCSIYWVFYEALFISRVIQDFNSTIYFQFLKILKNEAKKIK